MMKANQSNMHEIGLKSHQRGKSFEEKIAELYRLLHYEVEHGRIFSGRQVDLFLKGRFGDLTILRAIECKAGPVKTEHIDIFLIKFQLVKKEYPSVQGTIVSGVSFTDSVVSHANSIGIQLITYRDLSAQLFDGHSYARELIKECESNDQYSIKKYIKQFIRSDDSSDVVAAEQFLASWLDDENWNQITLLGDLGTGKTFLSRMLSYKLALDYQKNPLENPFPIRIDLRHADREFSLEGLILSHLSKSFLPQVSFEMFLYLLYEGHIVLVLDGFDEMAARVSPAVTKRNFHELSRCVQKRSKVLLTCRTHYFKSRSEEEEILLGNRKKYESNVRELYWELISRKGYRIAYLEPFTFSQVEDYVHKISPDIAKKTLRKIKSTYNLVELSQRPLLLDMIVKSINKIKRDTINIATLYEIFTEAWIHREQWREVIPPETKINFLTALSYSLWQEELTVIHYTKLFEYLNMQFSGSYYSPQDILELDHEIRTASFLSRDEIGNYGFAHKSFSEYFLASYLAREIESKKTGCLKIRRLTPEVIGFLGKMVECKELKSLLKPILIGEYQGQISENAAVCWYEVMREGAISYYSKEDVPVYFPEKVQLNGAKLDQINFENAVLENANFDKAILAETNFRNADLTGSIISNANLERANLDFATLFATNLTNSNLSSAKLENTTLEFASLKNANLTNAVILNVNIEGADFSDADGSGVLILDDDIDKFIKLLGSRENVENIFQLNPKQRADESDNFLKMIYPTLQNYAKIEFTRTGVDLDEILGKSILEIINPSVIEKLKNYGRSELRAYIISTVRRIASQESKNEDSFYDEFGAQIPLEFVYNPSDNPELEAMKSDLKEKIAFILDNKMSDVIKRIVIHKFFSDYTIKEISELEGISVPAVHYRLNKAIEIIRREVQESNYDYTYKEF